LPRLPEPSSRPCPSGFGLRTKEIELKRVFFLKKKKGKEREIVEWRKGEREEVVNLFALSNNFRGRLGFFIF
jgi:hypothetical protein